MINRASKIFPAMVLFIGCNSLQSQIIRVDPAGARSLPELRQQPHFYSAEFAEAISIARPDVNLSAIKISNKTPVSPLSGIILQQCIIGSGGSRERFITDLLYWDTENNNRGELNGVLMTLDNEIPSEMENCFISGGNIKAEWENIGSTFRICFNPNPTHSSDYTVIGFAKLVTKGTKKWIIFQNLLKKPLSIQLLTSPYVSTTPSISVMTERSGPLSDDGINIALIRFLASIEGRYTYSA
ncbi:MAG: hypothetical protein U0P81_00980 [Holophagaceae bacterium]